MNATETASDERRNSCPLAPFCRASMPERSCAGMEIAQIFQRLWADYANFIGAASEPNSAAGVRPVTCSDLQAWWNQNQSALGALFSSLSNIAPWTFNGDRMLPLQQHTVSRGTPAFCRFGSPVSEGIQGPGEWRFGPGLNLPRVNRAEDVSIPVIMTPLTPSQSTQRQDLPAGMMTALDSSPGNVGGVDYPHMNSMRLPAPQTAAPSSTTYRRLGRAKP